MGRSSLSRNALSNLGAYAVTLLISFFLSPFIIHRLGNARYGVWSMTGEFIGYYGLLDIGIRGAVTYFVSVYSARNDKAGVGRSIASGFWFLALMGAAVALCGIAVAAVFPGIFGRGDVSPREITIAISIMSAAVGLTLPLEVCRAALIGYHRFDIVNAVEILSRAGSSFAIWLALGSGGGLVVLSAIYAGGQVLSGALGLCAARCVITGFSLSPAWFERKSLRELAGVGGKTVFINLSQIVIGRSDLIVVGAFLNLRLVTYYAVGRMLIEYAANVLRCVSQVFMPNLTSLYTRGQHGELERVYLAGVRVTSFILLALGPGILFFGRPFLGLWVGQSYVSGNLLERSDTVLVLLMLGALPRLIQSISCQLLFAGGRFTFVMWLNLAEAVANAALSIALVRPLGLAGVALGTLAPSLVTQGVVIPAYTLASFKISPARYFAAGVGRPALLGLCLCGLDWLLVRSIPPGSWPLFLAEVAGAGGLACVLGFRFAMNSEDRAQIRLRLLGR